MTRSGYDDDALHLHLSRMSRGVKVSVRRWNASQPGHRITVGTLHVPLAFYLRLVTALRRGGMQITTSGFIPTPDMAP